ARVRVAHSGRKVGALVVVYDHLAARGQKKCRFTCKAARHWRALTLAGPFDHVGGTRAGDRQNQNCGWTSALAIRLVWFFGCESTAAAFVRAAMAKNSSQMGFPVM